MDGGIDGEELLTELVTNLGFTRDLDRIKEVTVAPSPTLPYATSQFSPREDHRPAPGRSRGVDNPGAPWNSSSEIPDDCVFLVDYSTRSAQIGVYRLLERQEASHPGLYGHPQPIQWANALRAFLR